MSLAIALEAAAQHLRQLKQQRKALDEFLALENESGRAYALDKEIGKIQDAISSCAKEAGVWVEYLGETCMDGGTCHHECADRCFRRECCVPLTQAVDAGLTMEQWRYPEAAPQAVQAAVPEAIEQMAVDRYKVVPSHESMFHRWAVVAGNGTQQLYIGREGECQNMARKFMGAFLDGAFVAMQNAAPAHPAEGVPAATVANMPADPTEEMLEVLMAGEDRLRARHGDELTKKRAKERYQALLALVATQPAPAIFGDEDHVLVPRGLIRAACYAIDKKRDGTKTLAELRRYTTGDLSAATQPAAQAKQGEVR